jgi:hypothetical protein
MTGKRVAEVAAAIQAAAEAGAGAEAVTAGGSVTEHAADGNQEPVCELTGCSSMIPPKTVKNHKTLDSTLHCSVYCVLSSSIIEPVPASCQEQQAK